MFNEQVWFFVQTISDRLIEITTNYFVTTKVITCLLNGYSWRAHTQLLLTTFKAWICIPIEKYFTIWTNIKTSCLLQARYKCSAWIVNVFFFFFILSDYGILTILFYIFRLLHKFGPQKIKKYWIKPVYFYFYFDYPPIIWYQKIRKPNNQKRVA